MPNLTRLQLQTLVGDLINDPNNVRWTTAQKQNQLQVSQEQFVEDTRALTDTQQFSIISGTNTYALSTDTFDILRVALAGLALIRFSKFDLDSALGTNWTLDTGTPTRYYVDYTSTNKNLTLYPSPLGADVGTNNLVVEYVKVPPTLSSDTATPLNAQVLLQPYLMALAYHAANYFLQASSDQKDWVKAKLMWEKYQEQVEACKEYFVPLTKSYPRMRGGRYFKGRGGV